MLKIIQLHCIFLTQFFGLLTLDHNAIVNAPINYVCQIKCKHKCCTKIRLRQMIQLLSRSLVCINVSHVPHIVLLTLKFSHTSKPKEKASLCWSQLALPLLEVKVEVPVPLVAFEIWSPSNHGYKRMFVNDFEKARMTYIPHTQLFVSAFLDWRLVWGRSQPCKTEFEASQLCHFCPFPSGF